MEIKKVVNVYLQRVYKIQGVQEISSEKASKGNVISTQKMCTKKKALNPEAQIRIRLNWENYNLVFNVGYSISPDKWDKDEACVKRGRFNSKKVSSMIINRKISKLLEAIDNAFKVFEVKEQIPDKTGFQKVLFPMIGKKIPNEARVNKADITLLEAYTRYMLDVAKTKSWEESTFTKHLSLKRILNDFGGNNPVCEWDAMEMERYYDFLLDRGYRNTNIKRHLSFIKSFLRWCENQNYLNTDWKAFSPEIKTIHRHSIVFLTWSELMRLYNFEFPKEKAYLSRTRDIFCLQAFTSLRYSDVSRLKRSDIIDDVIHVVTEKTDTTLNIELNKYSKAILDKYKDEVLPDGLALPIISNQKENEYIKECCFVCGIDTPVTKTYYKGSEKIEEQEPKYKLVGTHTARRTFICNALAMGINPETVMKWTGHSNYNSMLPYIDVADEVKRKAMSLFDKM